MASRTELFLRKTQELWESYNAPPPAFVKSVGDGAFCVWEITKEPNRGDAGLPSRLIKDVLRLHKELPGALDEAWEDIAGLRLVGNVELGMGLAFGDAVKATLDDARDYYGYVINLAAKLQNLARPRGVVIGLSQHVRHTGVENPPGDQHLFRRNYPLAMAPRGSVDCLVTEEVDEVHTWTCLAWPGFAVARGEDGKRLGLNARGITVLTHEGLRGKLDSLKIWPRNGYDLAKADQFEFIIDDLDSLEAMKETEVVKLSTYRGRDAGSLIAPALRDAVLTAGFSFTPIRCGLNAVAWHDDRGAAVANHASYRETIELAGRESQFIVAMYDNVGASLPILLDAFCPNLRAQIFSFENPAHLDAVITGLRNARPNGADHKLFQVYGEIGTLAHCLHSGQVHAVLGGGAWLANFESRGGKQKISAHIPPDSRGFLWMEGAALLDHLRDEADKLREFLRGSVLTDFYQNALMEGLSYCSCPVTASLLDAILAENPDLEASITSAKKMIFADTRRIFEDSETISKEVIVRRRPALADLWEARWNEIKNEFCDVN